MSKPHNIFQGRGTAIPATDTAEGGVSAPTTIQIMPTNMVEAVWEHDERTFKLSDPEAVIAASVERAKDSMLVLDFNHGTTYFAGNAVAAGWLSNLRVEGGHIVADVTWTAVGRTSVEGLEYRFLSPTFTTDDETNEITMILSVGLVNFPAIQDLAKVASAKTEIPSMDPTLLAIRTALGLGDDATEAQILEGVQGSLSASAAGAAAIAALELAEGATGEDVTQAITTISASGAGEGNPDPAKFIPIAAFNEMRDRVAALETVNTASAAESAVAEAMKAGKVTPAMKDWAIDLATTNPDGFKAFTASAPSLGKGGKVVTGAAEGALGDDNTLTAEERTAIKASGVSEEAFLKTRAAKAAKKGS